MPTEIPKQYDPAAAEAQWLPFWEARGDFHADPPASGERHPKPPHVIMIPLPNVTGALHMGHALNGTLQDLLTRWRRMQGYEALWMPGTDHAGIATQSVVEKRMLEEKDSRVTPFRADVRHSLNGFGNGKTNTNLEFCLN